jgi:hypothetical protein
MTEIKIRKSWLRDPTLLLKKLGAVKGNQAYPSDVYISARDYEFMRTSLRKVGKKQRLGGRRLDMAVEMELLNYGPNQSLKNAIRQGFALVDTKTIKEA